MSFAVNTNYCPSRVMTQVKIEKVFKSSIYSQLPGWKEAQNNLNNTDTLEIIYSLKEKQTGRCLYVDNSERNSAVLETTKFWEPDSRVPSLSVQFIMLYKIKNSKFVSYVPVKIVATSGLILFQNPFKIKVKSVLNTGNSGIISNIDMGTVLVGIQ